MSVLSQPTAESAKPAVTVNKEQKKPAVYFPNLDGLRYFCFLSVFLFHSFSNSNPQITGDSRYIMLRRFLINGSVGVNFFFVLSGFLITYLLLTEKKETGRIHVGAFYVRRVLRIWPLYFFCVFFGFVLFPMFKAYFGQVPSEPANSWFYVTFLANFDFIAHRPDASVLAILWSVAVEEQFYLFWPLLMAFVPARFQLHLFGAVLALSLAFRAFILSHGYDNDINSVQLNINTLAIIGDFAIGGAAAWLAFTKRGFMARFAEMPRAAIAAIYAAVIVILLFRMEIFQTSTFGWMVDRMVLSTVFALVIIEQCFAKNSLFKLSRFPRISKLGTFTYGLYCLHLISILIVHTLLQRARLTDSFYPFILLEGIGSLALVMIMAYLSYNYFEKPFLKLKSKFALIKTTKP
ncbi:acyltransferase family protein [Flaviaesturariibacter terrae]